MSHKIETNNGVVIKEGRCKHKDASFNHETGEMKGIEQGQHTCCCGDKNAYKKQYEELIAEARAERNAFIEKSAILGKLATKADVAAAKDEVIAALPQEATTSQIQSLFS